VISLKVIGPLLTAAGSLVLAWRGKKLLDSLLLAQSAADVNILAVSGFLAKRLQHLPIITGTDEHVQRSQKLGAWLFVLGFALIAAGALVNAYAAWTTGPN
jgi:hypothetical protein